MGALGTVAAQADGGKLAVPFLVWGSSGAYSSSSSSWVNSSTFSNTPEATIVPLGGPPQSKFHHAEKINIFKMLYYSASDLGLLFALNILL